MKRLMIPLLLCAVGGLNTACIASRKFVRNEVTTSADALNAKIETNASDTKELRDNVKQVDEKFTREIGRVDARDGEQTQQITGLKGDVGTLGQKTSEAQSRADQAQNKADRLANDVVTLDQRFQNRNDYVVAVENAVHFAFDSAKLDSSANEVLDQIADNLLQNPNVFLVLEGRTDSVGNNEYNMRLGEQRVEAVKRYLVVEKSVPIYRLHEISFGSARPVADNQSREGRQKNRAVTLTILAPRAEPATASRN